MSHANAALTPRQRLRIARLIVDQGWPVAHAAAFFHVAWPTAKRWADRYAAMGAEGMADRSSRPHRMPGRNLTTAGSASGGAALAQTAGPGRDRRATGPAGLHRSRSVDRCRINRLHHIDIRTGEVVRRYEHDAPGAMIHVDVKKLGNIPDGGGWRYVGRQQGNRNRAVTPGKGRQRPPRTPDGHGVRAYRDR